MLNTSVGILLIGIIVWYTTCGINNFSLKSAGFEIALFSQFFDSVVADFIKSFDSNSETQINMMISEVIIALKMIAQVLNAT